MRFPVLEVFQEFLFLGRMRWSDTHITALEGSNLVPCSTIFLQIPVYITPPKWRVFHLFVLRLCWFGDDSIVEENLLLMGLHSTPSQKRSTLRMILVLEKSVWKNCPREKTRWKSHLKNELHILGSRNRITFRHDSLLEKNVSEN